MKFLLFIPCFIAAASSFAQTNIKNLLRMSEAYYANKTSGTIEYVQHFKMLSKNDTMSTTVIFTYYRENGRIARETYPGGLSNFYEDDYVYNCLYNRQNYIKAKSGYSRIPGWDPDAFFKPFYKNEKAGKLLSTQSQNECIISFTSNNEIHTIVIDTVTYRISRSIQTYVSDSRETSIEYDFKEIEGKVFPDSLRTALAVMKQSKKPISPSEASEATNKKEKDFKKALLQSHISIDTLNALAGADLQTAGDNHYILLDFFFQACKPCMEAIPELNALNASMDSNYFKLIGVDKRDTVNWEKFLALHPVSYKIIDGEPADKIHKLFPRPIDRFPTMILIKPDGNIEAYWIGYAESNMNELKKILSKAIPVKD